MWSRFSLSAPSVVVAGPYQHLWPLGALTGAVLGAKIKVERVKKMVILRPLHVLETISGYLDALGPCT